MPHPEGSETLRRFVRSLAEAEQALAGSGPEAARDAIAALAPAEKILIHRELSPDECSGAGFAEAGRRLARLTRIIEFGAAYWSGLVSCTVAAEAYSPDSLGRRNG